MADLDDEREWIRRSRDGDRDAFELLIKRHQQMIDSLAYRMTGSLTDAEDMTQEAFIQAFRQLDGYRGEARFSSWLYRIAMNLGLNWQSRRRRREKLHSDWSEHQDTAAPIEDRR